MAESIISILIQAKNETKAALAETQADSKKTAEQVSADQDAQQIAMDRTAAAAESAALKQEAAQARVEAAANKSAIAQDRLTVAQERYDVAASKFNASGEENDLKALIAADDGLVTAKDRATVAADQQVAAEKRLAIAEAETSKASADAAAAQEASAAKSESATGAFSGGLTKVAAVAAVAGIAVAGASVKMAADFQSSVVRLQTSAGETAGNINMVSKGIVDMAGQVGFSAKDLSDAMYTVDSANIHGADSLVVLKAAAQGAKAEGADLKTVVDAVTTSLADYHLPASQAANVTSQLITAISLGKTNLQDFAGSLHSITPMASSMNISLADVTGSLAAMTLHGMSADQASQNLAESLRTLMHPSTQATAALSQIGLTVNDLQDSLKKSGIQGTFEMISQDIMTKMGPSGKVLLDAFNTSKQAAQNLAEALKASPPAVQDLANKLINGSMSVKAYNTAIKALPADQEVLASSFLSMINHANGFTNTLKNGGPQVMNFNQMLQAATGNATTMNTALMLTGENSAGAAAGIKEIAGATADAKGNVKGWAEVQGTFNQKLAEAKDGAQALLIKMGEQLLPAVSALMGMFAGLAGFLSKNASSIGFLVSVLGPMVGVVLAIAAAIKVWAMVQAILNIALTANPIGVIIMLIAGLVGAVVYAYTHFTTFKNIVNDVFGGIGRIISTVISFVVGLFKQWGPLALAVLMPFIGIPLLIFRYWHQIVDWIVSVANDIWGFLKQWGPLALAILTPFIGIPLLIWQHWNQIIGWLRGVWSAMIGDVDGAVNWLIGRWQGAIDFFAGMPARVGGIFSAVWQGMTDGLRSALNWIIDRLDSFQVSIPSWVPLIGGNSFGFNIPHVAVGGPVSGMALVGENGPELVNLPFGSNVIPNSNTMSMLNNMGSNSGGSTELQVTFSGDTNGAMATAVMTLIRQGLIQIRQSQVRPG